jgi:hypothetical protein
VSDRLRDAEIHLQAVSELVGKHHEGERHTEAITNAIVGIDKALREIIAYEREAMGKLGQRLTGL